MFKKLILLLFSLVLSLHIIGQDAVFSQFNQNPLNTSAALTGAFNGKYRVGTSIRKQWFNITKYNTKSVYGDVRFNIVKKDYFSVGLIFLDDISGSNPIKLGVAYGNLSLAYSKLLSFDKYQSLSQYLTLGLQVGYGKRYFTSGNYLFGIQFDKDKQIVNPNIPSNEPLLSSRLYPNINLGLFYSRASKRNSFYLGINIDHINRPNISLLKGETSSQYKLYSLLVGGEFSLNRNFSLLPAVNIKSQGPYSMYIIGTNLRYQYFSEKGTAFRIGSWLRIPDSIDGYKISDIIITTILELNIIEIGISYDISILEYGSINDHRGAFELSLKYIWGNKPKITSINCPRF